MIEEEATLTSAKQGPGLGLLSTLDTLLVLATWEGAETLLVVRDTEGFGSCRGGFRVFGLALVRPDVSD